MRFAERMGLVPEKEIQDKSLDNTLFNRLCNWYSDFRNSIREYESNYLWNECRVVIDRIGEIRDSNGDYIYQINKILFSKRNDRPWYFLYQIIEEHIKIRQAFLQTDFYTPHINAIKRDLKNDLVLLNRLLQEEKSAYRFAEGQFVKITNKQELESISAAVHTQFESVNQHMKKAFGLYADRSAPDYENSIKESICAVEAMCCIITGLTGKQATLGNALKKLSDNGIEIHNALKEAFLKMYGYTSDADGIRHGGIDFTNAPDEDAKYMLVTCSAFVNYLIEKYERMEGSLDVE